ncbi:MAG TPA: hypothetical protein VGF97_08775 [Rhizomicrobium sp.]|jgi:hypothetical protein
MRRRRFEGRAATLADSCEADYVVVVTCGQCGAKRQMHPYRLIHARRSLETARLDTELSGFFCRTCRRSVSVTIACTFQHPGGW